MTPMKVGSRIYKNRMVASPIYCGTFLNSPPLDKVVMKSVLERSRGGCAAVTVGETPADFVYANKTQSPPIDYTNYKSSDADAFRRLTDVAHSYGAHALIEISHCGESRLAISGAKAAIGPMGFLQPDGVEVLAMDRTLMDVTVQSFVTAALFMKNVGFDGILLHAGHGWLLSQFLSPLTNHRNDEYGGSAENRARFPLAVICAVREAIGSDMLLELRVSGSERAKGGLEIGDIIDFVKLAEPFCDLVHVSVGLYRNPVLGGQFSSMYQPHGLNADMASQLRRHVSIPVTVVGGINSADLAESIIADGKADFVAMARQLTADPDFASKVAGGRADDITPCLRCYKCFPGPLEEVLHDLINLYGCTVNPEAFVYSEPEGSTASKKVLIIGGGIAGMQAAVTAADRSHAVTLVEKSGRLGGILNFTDSDAWKTDLRDYKNLMIRRVRQRSIDVRLNTCFSPEDVRNFGADKVIVAVGSAPIKPPVAGIENAVQALWAYENLESIGKRVIIIGGGLVGSELGLSLCKQGHEVTVIEMADSVAADAYPMHGLAMSEKLKQLDVRCGLCCLEIGSDYAVAEDKNGARTTFRADTVIYALGMRANAAEAETLGNAAPDCVRIGDCVRAAKVYDAVKEAWAAAVSI